MNFISSTEQIFHVIFHEWHWKKENYIAASSAALSFVAILFSIWSSRRAIRISQSSQLLSLIDKFIANFPTSLTTPVSVKSSMYIQSNVAEFYSIIVTFIQTVDNFKLDKDTKRLVLESFWLQCNPSAWDEIATGDGAKAICEQHMFTETIRDHRVTVSNSLMNIIKKHKGSDYPKNIRPNVRQSYF